MNFFTEKTYKEIQQFILYALVPGLREFVWRIKENWLVMENNALMKKK